MGGPDASLCDAKVQIIVKVKYPPSQRIFYYFCTENLEQIFYIIINKVKKSE